MKHMQLEMYYSDEGGRMSYRACSTVLVRWVARSCRSYVGTPSEVIEYREAKKRALQWVVGDDSTPTRHRKNPTAHKAIYAAIHRHLFNPLERMAETQSPHFLPPADSISALDTCAQMLKDLEPYLSSVHLAHFAQRISNILVFSQKDIWIDNHEPCLRHLCELIQLAMRRIGRMEIGVLLCSLGKWGPAALAVKVDEETRVYDIVSRMMERLREEGVKGSLTAEVISNTLDGCFHLNLQVNHRLMSKMLNALHGSIEFADTDLFVQLVVTLSKSKAAVNPILLERIAETAETKLRAGTLSGERMTRVIQSLGSWVGAMDCFLNLCRAAEFVRMQSREVRWTLEQDSELMKGFLYLRFFPSMQYLEHVHYEAKMYLHLEHSRTLIQLLSTFAEMGVRPMPVVDYCMELLEDVATPESRLSASDCCSILCSLALLHLLSPETVLSVLPFIRAHVGGITTNDKVDLYLAYLHCKYLPKERAPEIGMESLEAFVTEHCQRVWRSMEQERAEVELEMINEIRAQNEYELVSIKNGDFVVLCSKPQPNCALMSRSYAFLNCGRLTGSQLWRRLAVQGIGWRSEDLLESLDV